MTATTQTTTATPAASGAQSAGLIGSLAPILLMFMAFYFLIIRPQQKRDAKKRELINAVKRGDRVVTSGGILGTVHKVVGEKEVSLEISEGVRVRILKNSISEVLEKGTDLGQEEPTGSEVATAAEEDKVPPKRSVGRKAPSSLKKK
jgi:preprotein translocase subunit YajC